MPAPQQATALVPLSLSLVQKKEEALQTQQKMLQKRLQQRAELLCGLREGHERLLTTNGQLQERRRVRRETLLALREVLEDGKSIKTLGKNVAAGSNEVQATADKCAMLREVLAALAEKHSALEQRATQLEEQVSRESKVLKGKKERLNEARDTLLLQQEDDRSAQWSYDLDRVELSQAEQQLNQVSQDAQREGKQLEDIELAARMEKTTLQEIQTIVQNNQAMAHEELRQLTIANENAKSTQHELRKLLESNGATCPEDEEVLQSSQELQARLQYLNEEMADAKYVKRELALRRKQEKDILVITQTSIKAKDEQLSWLERQRVHLVNEQKEMEQAYAGDEAAYHEILAANTKEMADLADEIKTAEKQVKTAERAISAREKKVSAVNKKIAQRKKVVATWNEKIRERQEKMAQSTATQELVDSEIRGLEQELEQERRKMETLQQQHAAQEMETEDLLSSCAVLEADIRFADKKLAVMRCDIAAAETSVKNRIDEIRDKFLDTFVVSDSGMLIELLNKEAQSCSKADTDEFNAFDATIKNKAKMLKQQYDDLLAGAREKYGKILQQKEKQYDAKLEILRTRQAEKCGEGLMEQLTQSNKASTTNSNPEDGVDQTQDSEASFAEFDPPWLENENSDTNVEKVLSTKQRFSAASTKSKQVRRKTKAAPYQPSKSTQRELVTRNNPEDELTSNTLTHSVAAGVPATVSYKSAAFSQRSKHNEAGTRRPRLQKRTSAQKAGIVAKPTRRELYTSDPPLDVTSSAGSARATSSFKSKLDGIAVPDKVASKDPIDSAEDPIDSPNGCDDAMELSQPLLNATSTKPGNKTAMEPSSSSKAATKNGSAETQPKQAGKRGKAPTKRTSTKVSRRRQPPKVKTRRISLASQATRAADWSAADSFSFA